MRRTTPREHGTRARYVFGPFGNDRANGCHCGPCTAANNAYARISQKRRRLNRDRGAWARPYVPTKPAAARIRALQAAGVGTRQIAALAGLNRSQIGDITSGRVGRIRWQTEAAILAVTGSPSPGALTDAKPTCELVAQLRAAGVTKARIGQAVTGNPSAQSLQLRTDLITVRSARRVLALYEATFPYRCTCGQAFAGLGGWRAHNDELVSFRGHRLEVAA